MESKGFFILLVIVLVVILGIFLVANSRDSAPATGGVIVSTPEITEEEMMSEEELVPVQEFIFRADNEGFYDGAKEVDTIKVSRGDRVKILFQVQPDDVNFNGLEFRGFGVFAKAGPGEEVLFEFTAFESNEITSFVPETTREQATLDVEVLGEF